MHNRDFFYNNYKNHPEAVLQRIAGEYGKLTPQAQEALCDVLKERGFDELLGSLKVEERKTNLSLLSKDEVRRLINSRIAAGESLDKIKADLREKGVDIFNFASSENEAEEEIGKRMHELKKEGKSKEEIAKAVAKEFNRTPESFETQKRRMGSDGTWMIIVGGVILLISVPMAAVLLQHDPHSSPHKFWAIPGGILFLVRGIMKRRNAQRMNGGE